ncbi:MAG: DeoR/GlpR family DNA-binding transcription regulator [Bacteroidota bacterium]
MLKEERLQHILEEVRQKNKVLTIELSQQLKVSEDTVRRDLKELADLGQIKKVHGGAVSDSLNPTHYEERKVYAQEEKILLAEKALSLIRPHQVILMDGGTTNLELVKRFPEDLPLTVVTNSLPIAVELANHPKIDIIFLGGKLLKTAQVTIGPEVIEALQMLRADLCILGTRSIHHQLGITEIDWDETKVKRAMVAASHDTICMVITEKIGTVQPYIIGDSRQVSYLVSSLPQAHPIFQSYKEMGIEIV